ncbi:MAG: DUF4870 domain-containing protein [Planctomycetota bacterium]
MDSNTRTWAMLLHLSYLLGFVTGIGFIAPVIVWIIKKDEMPELDAHGKMALNFIISMFIYVTIAGLLSIALIGIPLLILLGIMNVVYPVIAGVKANDGELWHYPGMLRFF